MKKTGFVISTMFIAAVVVAVTLAGSSSVTADEANKLVYELKATNAQLNRVVVTY